MGCIKPKVQFIFSKLAIRFGNYVYGHKCNENKYFAIPGKLSNNDIFD